MTDGVFESLTVSGATDLAGSARVGADLDVGESLHVNLCGTVEEPLKYAVGIGSEEFGGIGRSGLFLGYSADDSTATVQGWSGGGVLKNPVTGTHTAIAAGPLPIALQAGGGSVGIGMVTPTAQLHINGDVRINDCPLWLRAGTEKNNGVGYFGPRARGGAAVFANTDLDGPVVFAATKGALGTTAGTQKLALTWTKDGAVGIGAPQPHPANRLQLGGPLHMDGNSIFLRSGPADEFDAVRWNQQDDHVDVGGYNGVNLCATGGGPSPVMKPVLTVGHDGKVTVPDSHNEPALNFTANDAFLTIGNKDNYGDVAVLGVGGNHRLRIAGDTGELVMRDENNDVTVTISSQPGDVVLAGADCAERFEVDPDQDTEPGTVLVIGPDGLLRPCQQAYDITVAGVVSGAGGITPGMVLNGHRPGITSVPVALVGRAFVKADADGAPISAGDLLTTSSTPGHAMKAGDQNRRCGAILGKALGSLAEGTGLLPVLVALS